VIIEPCLYEYFLNLALGVNGFHNGTGAEYRFSFFHDLAKVRKEAR
ncbi:MAG: hypothetical protein RI909_86, partial [Bacteroidota bacterium]